MDQYHFYDEIGKGRHSQVYKGRQKKTVEYVAIKRVDKALMDRVVNEVQVMHRLNSPHTLRFHNWYETRNNLWLILEYCTGGDMLSLLKQDVRLPEAAVKVFGVDLMTGLQYLHSHGYLFCDLKPSNVLVDEYGVVKLSDFGLSRRIPSPNTQNTSTPRKKGTPYYMAPELFVEDGVHSYKSELWSLGCMLFELYVGKPPWTSTSLNDLIRAILHEPFTFPPSLKVSNEFRDLLGRLLAKDPLKRATWKEALNHRFWSATVPPKEVTLPAEPLYEAMLETMRAQLPLTDELGESSLTESTLEESNDTRGSSVLDESTLVSTNISETLESISNLPPPSPHQQSGIHPLTSGGTPQPHVPVIPVGGAIGGGKRVDIVRMSAGARLNHGGGDDVTLVNRDTEVDFDSHGVTPTDPHRAPSSHRGGPQAGLGGGQGGGHGNEFKISEGKEHDDHYSQNQYQQPMANNRMIGGSMGAAGSSMASEGGFGGSESEENDDISPYDVHPVDTSFHPSSQKGEEVSNGGGEALQPAPLNLSVRSSRHGLMSQSLRQYEDNETISENTPNQPRRGGGGGVVVHGNPDPIEINGDIQLITNTTGGDGSGVNQAGGSGGQRMVRNEANLSKLKSKNRITNQPISSQPKARANSGDGSGHVHDDYKETRENHHVQQNQQQQRQLSEQRHYGGDHPDMIPGPPLSTPDQPISSKQCSSQQAIRRSSHGRGSFTHSNSGSSRSSGNGGPQTMTTYHTPPRGPSSINEMHPPPSRQQQNQSNERNGGSESKQNEEEEQQQQQENGKEKEGGEVKGGEGEDEDEYWAWEEEVGRAIPVSKLIGSGAGDVTVRPIVLNKFIEVIDKPPEFDVTCLPFDALSSQQILALSSNDLENYLTSVYKSLATKDILVANKVHVLSYLYRISHIDTVANIVINSSFAPLLLKMAKRFKSNNLRALVVTLLGLLVRHATLVVPDQADGNTDDETNNNDVGGLMRVMIELLKESNPKLRRRSIATLGELLFYVHTLEPSDPHAPISNTSSNPSNNGNGVIRWYVPGNTIPSLARCLQEDEDEIVCHYACKTVENILAQASPDQCRRFASLEIGVRLADLALRSQRKSEALHTTAATALAHFLRRVLLPDDHSHPSTAFPPPPSYESNASPAYGHAFNSPVPPGSFQTGSNNSDGGGGGGGDLNNHVAIGQLTPIQNIVDQSPSQPNSLSPAPHNASNRPMSASSATVAAGQPGAGGAAGPRLVSRIFERNGGGALTIAEGVLQPSSARIQVAFVTMVVALFWESGDGDFDSAALLSGGVWPLQSPRPPDLQTQDRSDNSSGGNAAATLAGRPLRQLRQQLTGNNSKLLLGLVRCVERGLNSTARAKAMVALRVVCARHSHALVQVLDRGLILKLEKLVSSPMALESDPYLRSCSLQLFIFLVTHVVDTTMSLINECYTLVKQIAPLSSSCYFSAPYPQQQQLQHNNNNSDQDSRNAINKDNGINTNQGINNGNQHQNLTLYLSSFSSVSHLIAAQCVNETLVAAPNFLDNIVRLLEFTCDSPVPTHMNQQTSSSSSFGSYECRYHSTNVPHSSKQHDKNSTTDKRRIDTAFISSLGSSRPSSASSTSATSSSTMINTRSDLQQVLLLTLQGLCKNAEILLPQRIPFIATKLLPCLCRILIENNSDARANTVTLLRLLLPPLLLIEFDEKQRYFSSINRNQEQYDNNNHQNLISNIMNLSLLSLSIENFVLPFLPILISSNQPEPIPQFVLSLSMELFQSWKCPNQLSSYLHHHHTSGITFDSSLSSLSFAEALTKKQQHHQTNTMSKVSIIDEMIDVAHRSPLPQVLTMANQLANAISNSSPGNAHN